MLKAALACLALLVLVPWRVMRAHDCIGVRRSADLSINAGMGQRRSHVVQLLVYIRQL